MKTEAGKIMAKERSRRIREFMEWWKDELEGGAEGVGLSPSKGLRLRLPKPSHSHELHQSRLRSLRHLQAHPGLHHEIQTFHRQLLKVLRNPISEVVPKVYPSSTVYDLRHSSALPQQTCHRSRHHLHDVWSSELLKVLGRLVMEIRSDSSWEEERGSRQGRAGRYWRMNLLTLAAWSQHRIDFLLELALLLPSPSAIDAKRQIQAQLPEHLHHPILDVGQVRPP